MNGLINVAIPVFGIILTGYLAGRFAVLGPELATALNRFVYYFAIRDSEIQTRERHFLPVNRAEYLT